VPVDELHSRRSNAERKAETIDRIINATLEAITEVGLRNATTGEIRRRAHVSLGALFHHFDTRLDVIVAAVEHHLRERLLRYTSYLSSQQQDVADPRSLIRMLRSVQREPRSMVWLEVVMETRTDAQLRDRIQPILQRQREVFRELAVAQPGLSEMPIDARNAWLELLRNVLHGEALWEHVKPHHDLDEPKLDALVALSREMGAPNHVGTP